MVRQYEPLYTVKEAAKVLRVNTQFVYGLINSNKLPGLRLGAIKIRGSDLENFLERYPVMNGKEVGEEEADNDGEA